ncbi:LuxR family transcriptional regulator [Sphaerisporangium flaviroseum]|uniref:LuxR family transcriptional regulator n=1 Tax=Sphaerisporangium flaviroseum TaxID=509199 RepID=A0ABP7IHU7_9ACTN
MRGRAAGGHYGEGFVGRERELARLREAWEAATRGEARVVGVAGDPGIGKTTLVRHFLRGADPKTVVWASGDQDEAALPWAVLTQITGALPGSMAMPPGGPVDPCLAGQALARDLQDRGGLILVVDDAHWADHPSMSVLRLAARRLAGGAVLIIVAYQTPGELSTLTCQGPFPELGDAWGRLLDSDRGLLLTLPGMSASELVRLAVACGHPHLSPAGAARLHEHTAGNPMHARHLLDELPMRSITYGHGPLPAPRSVAAAVRARLASCRPPARELVAAGAVLGRSFSLARVRELTGRAGTAEAAAEAIRAGLLEEVPGSAGHELAFTGTLVRGLAYHDLDVADRRELHHRAAAHGGPAALWHRIAAAERPDERLAADIEREAHARLARGEIGLAAVYLRQALDLTPEGPARAPRLLTTVETLLVAGDVAAALDHQGELAEVAPGAWRDYVLGYQLLLSGRIPEARQRLRRSLATLREGTGASAADPTDLEARVATQLAIIAVVTASYTEMVEYGSVAVATAREPWVAAFGWFASSVGLALAGRAPEALAALARADAPGAPFGLDGLVARGMIRLWTDDLEGARRDLTAAVRRAAHGETLRIGQALGFLGEVQYRMGALGEAVLHAELAVGDAEENDRVWDYAMVHALAGYPLAAQAAWERAEAHVEQAATWARTVGTAAGLTYASAGEAALAQARGDAPRLLAVAEGVPDAYPAPEPGTHLLGPLLADALSQLGRPTKAAEALDAFLARAGPTGRLSIQVCVARVSAQIAMAQGDPDRALRECRRAIPLARAAGLRLEAARLHLLMGGCLEVAGRRAAAERALRSALHQFTAMGAAAYVAQTLQAAGHAGLSLDGPPAPLGTLTPAERAVVTLVCQGLSNREIAERLVLSRKTVEFHLTNVYRRLDVTTRRDLRQVVTGPG